MYHLSYFNHEIFETIESQIFCLNDFIITNNEKLSISKSLVPNKIIITIEAFYKKDVKQIINFCKSHKSKIWIILTEHMDLTDDNLYWHGEKISAKSNYMPDNTLRFWGLLKLIPYVTGFITIGYLPILKNINNLFPGIQILRCPFPRLKSIKLNAPSTKNKENSIVFFGKMTDYRRHVLNRLKEVYEIQIISDFKNIQNIRRICKNKKFCLNIPQNDTWEWNSPMRSILAFRLGMIPISISEKKFDSLSNFDFNFSISDFLQNKKTNLLENISYAQSYQKYEQFRRKEKSFNNTITKFFNH